MFEFIDHVVGLGKAAYKTYADLHLKANPHGPSFAEVTNRYLQSHKGQQEIADVNQLIEQALEFAKIRVRVRISTY